MQFWIGWFLFGFLVAAWVYSQAPQDRNKALIIPFYLLIILAGPLLMLLIFIPKDVCQRAATNVRDWFEKTNTPTSGTGPGGNSCKCDHDMLGGPGA